MSRPLPLRDLDEAIDRTPDVWPSLRGARLFFTGGSGFFGTWMLATLARADDRFGLGAQAVVLTRDPAAFAGSRPWLAAHRSITTFQGDVLGSAWPEGAFSHTIHLAADTTVARYRDAPLLGFDTIVQGTRNVLRHAVASRVGTFLLASSGAVYGTQPGDLVHVPEDHPGAPPSDRVASAYGEGKRASELDSVLHAHTHGFSVKLARCFAFVGPLLPLDTHFAVGNFIRDALAGGPLVIQGDGTPHRSYLYAGDLSAWLWALTVHGTSGRAYNVGSDESVSIADLARRVSAVLGGAVEIRTPPTPGRLPARYVPDVTRARTELGLAPWTTLEEGVRRTAAWVRGEP